MKKERPIIFNNEMVRAIMEGRKTETRRVVKPQPDYTDNYVPYIVPKGYDYVNGRTTTGTPWAVNCPYGKPGDLLYVREGWQHTECLNIHPTDENYGYVYKAGNQPWKDYEGWKWKPSIHMPKKAARIWLEIQDRWVERLQDISEEGAENEGVEEWPEQPGNASPFVRPFADLWDSIHGPGSWEQNPFVWVVKFKVVSTNGKPV